MKQRTQSAKLSELATYLHRYTEADAGANLMTTPIEGLSIRRSNPMKQPMQCLIKHCMTVQGSKLATFGTKRYNFGAGEALVVTVDMPSRGTAFAASRTQPYLGLVFEFDLEMLQTVANDIQLEQAARTKVRGALRSFWR